MLDPSIIRNFRGKVNEDEFIFHLYHDVNSINKWNCICSAMDWIEVSIDYINSDWRTTDSINIACIQLYSYISSIDILWESVLQLHRVLVDNNIPFQNNDDCFKEKISCEDDNNYFKTIRACFGAHPVNLSDPINKNDKSFRRYASWPFDSSTPIGKGDFQVFLYSNRTEGVDLEISIYVAELESFAQTRYNYLNTLFEVINKQYNNYLKKHRNIPIEKAENYLQQLEILKNESKLRLDNDYYSSAISELILIFKVNVYGEVNSNLLDAYKNALKAVIDELYCNLQNMDFIELEHDNVLSPKHPSELNYSMEKLSNAAWGRRDLYAQTKLEEYLHSIIEYDAIQSIEERYSLTLAALYKKTGYIES